MVQVSNGGHECWLTILSLQDIFIIAHIVLVKDMASSVVDERVARQEIETECLIACSINF